MKKIPLIVVAGPTASGKTALAIDIAKSVGGEIVSADSMQIYKYMDIGTAKATPEEMAQCPHHMIDIIEPDCDFSVADYAKLAHSEIENIINRGNIPILCGGTGLYIDSVVNDVEFGENDVDYALRDELMTLAKDKGGETLIKMLAEFDPISANRLHPNNLKRVVRAIEFYKTTGVPISEHQAMTKLKESRYNAVSFMITHDREKLYERINRRVDIMLDEGLYDEVKLLLDMGYGTELNSMQGIGYKELALCIKGETTLAEATEAVKQNSRRYAKRQLTWFRRNDKTNLLDPDGAAKTALGIIKKHYINKNPRPYRSGKTVYIKCR